jgi:exonuclease SbcD
MLVEVDDGRIATVELVDLAVVRWESAQIELKGKSREAELVEAIRAALTQAYEDAENRPTAVRLTLAGETPLHDVIERRPNRLLQTVVELAAEVGGEDIWIEKIRNNTAPPVIASKPQANETTNDLVQIMEEVAGDTTQVSLLLQRELEPLRTKLPEELKELPALKLLDDPSLVLTALTRLKPRLASRLAGEEDD